MAERITREVLAEQATIHEAAALRAPTTVDRSFELPTGLYVAMAGLFFAYVGLMFTGFANPVMVIPAVIFAIFIGMSFAVPAMWVRMAPENSQKAMNWDRFRRLGIMTGSGHSTAGAAAVQVLLMPTIILLWGITVVTIAAAVR